MKSLIVFFALLLVFPAAFADEKCQRIRGQAEFVGFEEPCHFDGTEYAFCIVAETRGTLKGTWVSYFQEDWTVLLEELEGLPIPTPPGAFESLYNREFDVFTSRRGEIWGESQYVFDLRVVESGGGTAVPVIITGGSGKYEDAYGWITPIVTNADLTTFSMHGRVCRPSGK